MPVIRKAAAKSRTFVANAGYRVIGGRKIYFRSNLEVNYAMLLETYKKKGVIKEWEYEPETFWFENIKRGVRSYKPDFKVTRNDDTHYWAEVKGYMDAKSKTKIRRFVKYYPVEELRVITKEGMKKFERSLPTLCEGWENEFTEGMSE